MLFIYLKKKSIFITSSSYATHRYQLQQAIDGAPADRWPRFDGQSPVMLQSDTNRRLSSAVRPISDSEYFRT